VSNGFGDFVLTCYFPIIQYPKKLIIGISKYPNMFLDIFDFNPWWETGGIDREFSGLKRRHLFNVLFRALDERFIDVVIGLRRVGLGGSSSTIILNMSGVAWFWDMWGCM